MKRVLFVTRCFPPAQGGMERFAADLHGALNERVELHTLQYGGSKPGLVVILPYFFIRALWLLVTKQIDVIHAQDGVVSIMLRPLAWLFKKPMVVVIHGLDITFKLALFQWLIRWSLRSASAIVCISSAARDEVVKRGIPAAKTNVIPIGVTDDLFTSSSAKARAAVSEAVGDVQDRKVLLCSGRLVKRKGVAWFIEHVLPVVTAKQPQTLLLVSGDGPDRENIQQVVSQTDQADAVWLLGRTSDELLKNLYNSADCFVMPNIPVAGDMEGFGRVLIEAALCEVPVVASKLEGIVDAVHDGKNGRLVRAEDADAFARAVLQIIQDEPSQERAKKQAKKARAYSLQTFGWEHIAGCCVDLYDKLTEDDRAGAEKESA